MKFRVDNISCGGCAHTVRRAVAQVDARANVQVDIVSKEVDVQSAVPRQLVKDALESVGFHVSDAD